MPCPDTSSLNCWESCTNPGPNCTACTNTFFLLCPYSNQCIHPDLQCDGHPQCEHGEDEDLDMCKEKYQQNKVISKYATFRCQSIMYPIMETYATACNDFPECVDGEDERLCFVDSALFFILPMAFLAISYLILKFGRFLFNYYKKSKEKVYSFHHDLEKEILAIYSDCHGKDEDIEKINSSPRDGIRQHNGVNYGS